MKRTFGLLTTIAAITLIALFAMVNIGCGDADGGVTGAGNPTITGPDDSSPGITETVGIRKSTHEELDGKTRTVFYLRADTKVDEDLPVLVTYKNGESEFVMIRAGESKSMEFPLNEPTSVEEAWMRASMPIPIDVKGGGKIPYGYDFRKALYMVDEGYRQVKPL